jgi:hypothetical protein
MRQKNSARYFLLSTSTEQLPEYSTACFVLRGTEATVGYDSIGRLIKHLLRVLVVSCLV